MQSQIKLRLIDDIKFRLVALLVDRPDFLRDLEKIRKDPCMGFTNLLPYEQILDHLRSLGDTADGNTGDLMIENFNEGTSSFLTTRREITDIVDWLKSKYLKNSSFDMVFTYAIYAGEVRDDAIRRTAYVQYLDRNILKNFTLDSRYQVSIVISPETSPRELTTILSTEVSLIFPDWPKRKNRIGKFKRDRRWYWLSKKMTWEELFTYVNKNKAVSLEFETIRSAVRDYENRLSVALYSNIPPGEIETS